MTIDDTAKTTRLLTARRRELAAAAFVGPFTEPFALWNERAARLSLKRSDTNSADAARLLSEIEEAQARFDQAKMQHTGTARIVDVDRAFETLKRQLRRLIGSAAA